jgi:hypothetical protein
MQSFHCPELLRGFIEFLQDLNAVLVEARTFRGEP